MSKDQFHYALVLLINLSMSLSNHSGHIYSNVEQEGTAEGSYTQSAVICDAARSKTKAQRTMQTHF